jgi:hypothetical protein
MKAALQDQGSAEWGCAGTAITGADGKAVGTGIQNTADIVAGCNEPGIAAKIADDYTYNGYTDWFLPSNDELNLMWTNIGQGAPPPFTNVGGFANNIYWSSSESGDTSYVLIPNIYGGATTIASKNTSAIRVRAIRAF